jgi:colanic acid/amylovoran biosynthesis protein
VPLNGGDEALLRAAVEAIQKRWPEAEIKVLCRNVAQASERVPDLDVESDLEHAYGPVEQFLRRRIHVDGMRMKPQPSPGSPPTRPRRKPVRSLIASVYRTWRRHSDLGRLIRGTGPSRLRADLALFAETRRRREIVRLYRDADIILSSPGGFFSDFYEIEGRLRGLEVALAYGKPVVLLGQSIGPFWKPESITRTREVFSRVSRICVRDAKSTTTLREIGVDSSLVCEGADIAFLWRDLAPELFRAKSGPIRRIGMCFRVWPLDDLAQAEETLAKARRLIGRLLEDPSVELYFVSTCQGIPGYVDDSELAVRLVAELPAELAARCTVDRERHDTRALMRVLGECDLMIGMRLHACILSMLAGTPAMGLGYEHKTEAVFGQMGFGDYHVAFDSDLDSWLSCLDRVLRDLDIMRTSLPTALDRQASDAARHMDALAEFVASPERIEGREQRTAG